MASSRSTGSACHSHVHRPRRACRTVGGGMWRYAVAAIAAAAALGSGLVGAQPASRSLGLPWAGSLVGGVQLPAEGEHFFTWDNVRRRSPNRGWRRWGNRRLVTTALRVLDDDAAAYPGAPRVGIGDLSRRHGGDFGPRFGGIGHASHQNGLDIDVYYPRRDRRELAPRVPRQIDRRFAQALLDRFVASGAAAALTATSPGSWPRRGRPGPPPASEVETQLAMQLIVRLRPDVTIWFHQPQGLVRASGPSVPVARRYARLAGMRFARLRWPPGSATA